MAGQSLLAHVLGAAPKGAGAALAVVVGPGHEAVAAEAKRLLSSYNPGSARGASLGFSLFARHYSGNHYYFLFLPVLRCFSSRGWLSFE